MDKGHLRVMDLCSKDKVCFTKLVTKFLTIFIDFPVITSMKMTRFPGYLRIISEHFERSSQCTERYVSPWMIWASVRGIIKFCIENQRKKVRIYDRVNYKGISRSRFLTINLNSMMTAKVKNSTDSETKKWYIFKL